MRYGGDFLDQTGGMMKLGSAIVMGTLATFIGTGIAHANWLDDAWSEKSIRINGNPAITIHGDSIYVVLPTATLLQAHYEGVATEDALGDFLERYGPRCSKIVDLNVAHPKLTVALSLQSPGLFEDISEKDVELTALRNAHSKFGIENDVPHLFTVSRLKLEYSINYVPKRRVRCVTPRDPTS
jgi:hypothetical protein